MLTVYFGGDSYPLTWSEPQQAWKYVDATYAIYFYPRGGGIPLPAYQLLFVVLAENHIYTLYFDWDGVGTPSPVSQDTEIGVISFAAPASAGESAPVGFRPHPHWDTTIGVIQ